MSRRFKNGVNVNTSGCGHKALRIRAGKQRGMYVHTLVMRALQIGRREGFANGFRYGRTGCIVATNLADEGEIENSIHNWYPLDFETVEHKNGDSLDCDPGNLEPVTQSENTRLMHQRRENGQKIKTA